MNRIEQIKKEIERFNNKPDYIHATGPEIIGWLQYLLAKLEQADITLTKALEGDGVLRQYEEVVEDYSQLHSAVSEALKAIRE